MTNSLNVNIPNMLKQNTKLKSKNQNLEKNAVTWSRSTLHKITLLVFPNLKLKSKMLLLKLLTWNNITNIYYSISTINSFQKRKLLAIANSLNLSI